MKERKTLNRMGKLLTPNAVSTAVADAGITLAGICGDQKAPPAARVAAAEALLNRAWGRPTQRLAGDEIAGPLKISWIS
jgi:hypothetical protein